MLVAALAGSGTINSNLICHRFKIDQAELALEKR